LLDRLRNDMRAAEAPFDMSTFVCELDEIKGKILERNPICPLQALDSAAPSDDSTATSLDRTLPSASATLSSLGTTNPTAVPASQGNIRARHSADMSWEIQVTSSHSQTGSTTSAAPQRHQQLLEKVRQMGLHGRVVRLRDEQASGRYVPGEKEVARGEHPEYHQSLPKADWDLSRPVQRTSTGSSREGAGWRLHLGKTCTQKQSSASQSGSASECAARSRVRIRIRTATVRTGTANTTKRMERRSRLAAAVTTSSFRRSRNQSPHSRAAPPCDCGSRRSQNRRRRRRRPRLPIRSRPTCPRQRWEFSAYSISTGSRVCRLRTALRLARKRTRNRRRRDDGRPETLAYATWPSQRRRCRHCCHNNPAGHRRQAWDTVRSHNRSPKRHRFSKSRPDRLRARQRGSSKIRRSDSSSNPRSARSPRRVRATFRPKMRRHSAPPHPPNRHRTASHTPRLPPNCWRLPPRDRDSRQLARLPLVARLARAPKGPCTCRWRLGRSERWEATHASSRRSVSSHCSRNLTENSREMRAQRRGCRKTTLEDLFTRSCVLSSSRGPLH
jgi:hypothetical protein